MIPISKMASAVKPSPTLAAGAKARQMKADGIKVFDFSLGEPDFPTPAHICAAAQQAMKDGHTHYTPASGIPELRRAIAESYKKTYGYEVAPEQVIVSNGAKHSIHNVLSALCGPGDEVLIPSPYWVSYSDIVQMTGASYRLIPASFESHFKIAPDQLRASISSNSRVLMLNSPSNPTGVVYSRDELSALADVALDMQLTVLSDEIYEQLIYGDEQATCFATLKPGLAEQTLTISGVSKSYAMTGWRMGWTVGPEHVIKAMASIQSQQTGNPSSISQYATIAALTGDQECVAEMRAEFAARRELLCARLEKMNLRCPTPGGAFYAFFDVSQHFGRTLGGVAVDDSISFCKAALETVHVNLVPGSAFGAEGFVRMSFASSRDVINGGMDRLGELLGI